jgi:succinoglycan biosynthesis protein ExoA
VLVREHPETASFRYLAPPVAAGLVAVGLVVGLAGVIGLAAGAPLAVRALTAGFVLPVGYLAGITAAGAALTRGVPGRVRARAPLVLGVMHMSWGTGFLVSPRKLHRARGRETTARSAEKEKEASPEGAAVVGGE